MGAFVTNITIVEEDDIYTPIAESWLLPDGDGISDELVGKLQDFVQENTFAGGYDIIISFIQLLAEHNAAYPGPGSFEYVISEDMAGDYECSENFAIVWYDNGTLSLSARQVAGGSCIDNFQSLGWDPRYE